MKEHYIYKADVLCADCGDNIKTALDKQGLTPEGAKLDPPDETLWDSDEYPKGPYIDGEADSPQYCADCGEFLENDLTTEGEAYVFQWILETLADPADVAAVDRAETLMEYYAINLQDLIRYSSEVARKNQTDDSDAT